MFVVTGAYGRKYKTLTDAQKDWESNKDFYIIQGSIFSYINRADWEKYNKGWDSVYFVDGTLSSTLEVGVL